MNQKRHYGNTYVQIHTTKELLVMQSKGKFLNPKEKELVKRYAENKRKQKHR